MPVEPSSDAGTDRLPFEPTQKKKSSAKSSAKSEDKPDKSSKKQKRQKRQEKEQGIPKVVSRRMLRRMAIFSGIPSVIGISCFFLFYYVIDNQLFDFPPALVLISTLGCFGLGFVGLNYGIFSASWDEDRQGSWLGWADAKLNFQRIRSSQADAKQTQKAEQAKRDAEESAKKAAKKAKKAADKAAKKANKEARKKIKSDSNSDTETPIGFESDAKQD